VLQGDVYAFTAAHLKLKKKFFKNVKVKRTARCKTAKTKT
jgi:hypothetical protein